MSLEHLTYKLIEAPGRVVDSEYRMTPVLTILLLLRDHVSSLRLHCFHAVVWATGRVSGLLKVLPQQCSWLTMTAWWQQAVSKSETLLLSQEGCFLEARGQGSPRNHRSVTVTFSCGCFLKTFTNILFPSLSVRGF